MSPEEWAQKFKELISEAEADGMDIYITYGEIQIGQMSTQFHLREYVTVIW